MARFVWFALLVLAVVALWRGWRRRERAVRPPPQSHTPSTQTGLMVQCAHCGIHLDGQDAIQARGRYYCCAAHLEAGEKPSSRP